MPALANKEPLSESGEEGGEIAGDSFSGLSNLQGPTCFFVVCAHLSMYKSCSYLYAFCVCVCACLCVCVYVYVCERERVCLCKYVSWRLYKEVQKLLCDAWSVGTIQGAKAVGLSSTPYSLPLVSFFLYHLSLIPGLFATLLYSQRRWTVCVCFKR